MPPRLNRCHRARHTAPHPCQRSDMILAGVPPCPWFARVIVPYLDAMPAGASQAEDTGRLARTERRLAVRGR